jgi:heme/copper-type cytochrome/quinol oxidase subunit 2
MTVEDKRARDHFTVRRGFIAAAGFGLTSLYLVWAGYGAAPLGLHGDEHAEGAHGGHGAEGGAAAASAVEEFKREVQQFTERSRLADGSVRPRRAPSGGHEHGAHSEGPVDVYLMAYQWGFAPAVLRLEAGVPYRFRMMAVDITHGVSFQLGKGARVVRLRPGALVEQEYLFSRAGEHLVYCTVYCGLPHDRMHARLIVAEGRS